MKVRFQAAFRKQHNRQKILLHVVFHVIQEENVLKVYQTVLNNKKYYKKFKL